MLILFVLSTSRFPVEIIKKVSRIPGISKGAWTGKMQEKLQFSKLDTYRNLLKIF